MYWCKCFDFQKSWRLGGLVGINWHSGESDFFLQSDFSWRFGKSLAIFLRSAVILSLTA